MSTLSEYLNDVGITQGEFALSVGTTQATISRLAKKVAKPSLELAVMIERRTSGRVTAASWVPEEREAATP